VILPGKERGTRKLLTDLSVGAFMSFKVTGRITVLETGIPIPTLRVQIWDKDLLFDDDLGEVVTHPDGSFEHTFERADFDDFGIEAYPDLYLIITTGEGRVLIDTMAETRYNASENEHFAFSLPEQAILEDDGALFWAIRPRVVGVLSVSDGDTNVPTYIDKVADAFDEMLVELWDPVNQICVAVDEPSNHKFMLWYWIGSHATIRELEIRIKLGAVGKEIYRSRRVPVALDTQQRDVAIQRRVLVGADKQPLFYSHTNVPAGATIERPTEQVITVEPAPPRALAPSAAVSPFASPTLPDSPHDAVPDDSLADDESPPEPYRMILASRPAPTAKVSDTPTD
jgi:hypothetical protein